MTSMHLCTGKLSEKPFSLKDVGVSIFSVEELCYVLGENAWLINEDFFTPELIDWIEKECFLPELAKKLREASSKKVNLLALIGVLFDFLGYYTNNERLHIEQFIANTSKLSKTERKKNAADYLIKTDRINIGLSIYYSLLEEDSIDDEFKAVIYHNIGCAYVRFFLYEKALDYFKQSFEIVKNENTLLCIAGVMRLLGNVDKYLDWVSEVSNDYMELILNFEKNYEMFSAEYKEQSNSTELEDASEEDTILYKTEKKEQKLYYSKLEGTNEFWKNQYRKMAENP